MAKHDIFMSFSLLSRCRSDLDRPLLRGVRSPLLLRPHLKIKKKKQKKRGNFLSPIPPPPHRGSPFSGNQEEEEEVIERGTLVRERER